MKPTGLLVALLSGFALFAATPAAATTPIGIALEIEDGAGVPLQLRAGGQYYVDVLDIRASLASVVDAGVSSLDTDGDFSDLPWQGVRQQDQEFVLLANANGTFTRRRFYDDAAWIELPSIFLVLQLDSSGRPVGDWHLLNAGVDTMRLPTDDFFVRRMRAIQTTRDCPAFGDCTGATDFEEEALVELRNRRGTPIPFALHPSTTSLQVIWSLKPWAPYEIPINQVQAPQWEYGFAVHVEPITPPLADGTYAPGTDVDFRIELVDGAGNRLHPQGSLPTYADAVLQQHPAGIQYYRAFFDPTTTFYRRKHRERMLMTQIIGPVEDIQPLRTIADLSLFLQPGSQIVATPARDGAYSAFRIHPQSSNVFGGAFDPTLAGWFAPVSDEFTFSIPADAAPGTYLITTKGRRVYLGQDIADSETIEIQVGTPVRGTPHLTTGNCQSCHNNGGELSKVLHANSNRAACNGCHVPLGFELEGPIFVRTHFIHSRSDRFDAPLDRCTNCHLEQATIQRASKAACLSCHNSYPAWHETRFGPIESMYVGGGRESFDACSTCHTSHPNSGF